MKAWKNEKRKVEMKSNTSPFAGHTVNHLAKRGTKGGERMQHVSLKVIVYRLVSRIPSA